MKTLGFVDYDAKTATVVCRFADEFSDLPRAVQLDIAVEVRQRFADLVEALEAIMARGSAGTS